jgi:hypothetical protein
MKPAVVARACRTARGVAAVTVLLGGLAAAGEKAAPPELSREHLHPSGSFSFRTPEDWSVQPSPTNPNALEAGGGTLLVRFLYRADEPGFDSLHVTCMVERLAGAMAMHPQVKYEYDFLSGPVGNNHRALDSAFVVTYDEPILGHKQWRQRNVTLVGGGESLCIIAYSPLTMWKKSPATRALLDAVVASLTLRPRS